MPAAARPPSAPPVADRPADQALFTALTALRAAFAPSPTALPETARAEAVRLRVCERAGDRAGVALVCRVVALRGRAAFFAGGRAAFFAGLLSEGPSGGDADSDMITFGSGLDMIVHFSSVDNPRSGTHASRRALARRPPRLPELGDDPSLAWLQAARCRPFWTCAPLPGSGHLWSSPTGLGARLPESVRLGSSQMLLGAHTPLRPTSLRPATAEHPQPLDGLAQARRGRLSSPPDRPVRRAQCISPFPAPTGTGTPRQRPESHHPRDAYARPDRRPVPRTDLSPMVLSRGNLPSDDGPPFTSGSVSSH